ncbi:hypothetical protein WG66_014836, partial [Moniliophthora roreri]
AKFSNSPTQEWHQESFVHRNTYLGWDSIVDRSYFLLLFINPLWNGCTLSGNLRGILEAHKLDCPFPSRIQGTKILG